MIGPDDDPTSGGWLRSAALRADPTEESDWPRQFASIAQFARTLSGRAGIRPLRTPQNRPGRSVTVNQPFDCCASHCA